MLRIRNIYIRVSRKQTLVSRMRLTVRTSATPLPDSRFLAWCRKTINPIDPMALEKEKKHPYCAENHFKVVNSGIRVTPRLSKTSADRHNS